MLLRQWIDETKKHAPSLTYIVYEGYADMMADWFDRDLSTELKETARKRKREQTAEEPEKMALKPRPDEEANSFFQRWYDKWIEKMRTTDIVFVTYDTMGKDLDVALAPVERPRRAAAGPPREKPRSVLSMCQFWRVSWPLGLRWSILLGRMVLLIIISVSDHHGRSANARCKLFQQGRPDGHYASSDQ
jgi:hypothetical protein